MPQKKCGAFLMVDSTEYIKNCPIYMEYSLTYIGQIVALKSLLTIMHS